MKGWVSPVKGTSVGDGAGQVLPLVRYPNGRLVCPVRLSIPGQGRGAVHLSRLGKLLFSKTTILPRAVTFISAKPRQTHLS